MAPVLDFAGVSKRFGDVTALDDVSFEVAEGSVHGLIGPNGAGKSTLLRLLFGLVHPDSGTVTVCGRRHESDGTAATLEPVAGFVDRPGFWPYLTARRTLELLALADAPRPSAPPAEVLEVVGLTDQADRKVKGWSTGMRQRLGIAAALLRRPRLLVLDEPTEGLDPTGARQLVELVGTLAAGGVTVVMSSHDMDEVDAICDDATVLRMGRVVRSADVATLRSLAPVGRHRLRTTDDAAAQALAVAHEVRVGRHPRGGLLVEAVEADLNRLVCDLGRRDVAVTALEEEVAPLTALYYSLTDGAEVPA